MGSTEGADPEPVEEIDRAEDDERCAPPDELTVFPTGGSYGPPGEPTFGSGAPLTYLDSEPTEPPPIRGDTR